MVDKSNNICHEMCYETCRVCDYTKLIPIGILPRGSCPKCRGEIQYIPELQYQQEVRNGTRPFLITDYFSNDTRRTWVDSEKRPLLPYDGFRVLSNNQIFEWKKKWWIFGKWIKLHNKTDFTQIAVLDEGLMR